MTKRTGENKRLNLICECGRAPLSGAHSTFHKIIAKKKISKKKGKTAPLNEVVITSSSGIVV